MTPLLFVLTTFGISILAGLLGSLLGLGGGIIVVPALTLLLKIDIHYAIGASIVSVIATSSGAAAAYVRQHMSNLRVAMLLELATAAGALGGAYLAGKIGGKYLYILFGMVLAYTAVAMFRSGGRKVSEKVPADRMADGLRLHSDYFDQATGEHVHYRVTRTYRGLIVSTAAGIISGLLGVGGGVIKVPVMNLWMNMPLKVCTATSNFMIGVTAAAGAGVYFARGDINPFIAAPVASGVLLGATLGSRLMGRIHRRHLQMAFVVVLIWVAIQMLYKGVRA